MAQEAGVAEKEIAAVLERRFEDMTADTALAARFAEAVIAHDLKAEDYRGAVRAQWGEEGVATLALAIAIGRVFPMLKAGMGYAATCHPVQIGARRVGVVQRAA